jgi:hypothetical protein
MRTRWCEKDILYLNMRPHRGRLCAQNVAMDWLFAENFCICINYNEESVCGRTSQ